MRNLKHHLAIASTVLALAASAALGEVMPLLDVGLHTMEQGFGRPQENLSVDRHGITIAGQKYEKGLGTHAGSELSIDLDGKAEKFHALVGLDDETLPNKGSAEFLVWVDGKVAWQSGVMRTGDAAKPCDVDLTGAKSLVLLVTDGGNGMTYDHANWAMATLTYAGAKPREATIPVEERVVLTPKPAAEPRINSAKVYGARPGSPVIFKVASTGDRPLTYKAENLPAGLALDEKTGVITGSVEKAGTYTTMFTVTNAKGTATKPWRLEIGETLALTPPMGWNSWNVYGTAIDQEKVKAATDAFVKSGLIDHGWSFVNIDDAWSNKPGSNDPLISGKTRDERGMIVVNKKFPDMKGLVDYIHSHGLKAGIYSSPGPLTCGGYVSSYGYEEEDAQQIAAWGFDYLKYDWCSYNEISGVNERLLKLPERGPLTLRSPYTRMHGALRRQNRDVVYSLCQYGWGDVWEWGGSVGGQLWRTTDDINDSWSSMSGIGFSQAGHEKFAKPGNWNDPDMLVVGMVGWGPKLHDTKLTPNEQYTHITLWSLLASPLLIGCDMTQMDDFTRGLLTNDEVIEINQDPLGKQASRISKDGYAEVWAKPMEDGSVAIGLFNRGLFPIKVSADLSACGVPAGDVVVRDVWRQQDIKSTTPGKFEAEVARHGTMLIRVRKGK